MPNLRYLTEDEWNKVFVARCQSKQGRSVSDEERALCLHAYRTDPKRYRSTEKDVFNATVPFGSNVRAE